MMIRTPGETNWRTPAVTSYADERAIQSIIEQSPDLLPGTTGSGMAVVSELTVVDAGYVDIVGVDADGAITHVECKLKANPEIRRHIVGQVLAYAAGLWGHTYDEFDQVFAPEAPGSFGPA